MDGSTTSNAIGQLPLARIQHWERARANQTFLTQPMGDGTLRTWSWAQAMDESRRLAAFFRAQGWPSGSSIAILSKNSAYWIMADFAIWLAGHVSVPLYPTLSAGSIRQILAHCDAKAIFVGKLDNWDATGIPEGTLSFSCELSPKRALPVDAPSWESIIASTLPLAGEIVRDGNELATIVYTSGTTGMPKGVMHSFASIGWSPQAIFDRFTVTAEDRMLSYLPLSHVAERWVVEACAIRAGFQLFFVDTQESFVADLQRARPTLFISVPRLWVKFQQGVFAQQPKEKLDRLMRIPILGRIVKKKLLKALGLDQVRMAGGGAAPMPAAVLEWYQKIGLDLLEGYGMTENFGVSHASKPGRARIGYVGEPYNGVEHRIGPDGEVLVRSRSNMLGYFREPEKTREALTEDGWLHTGDRGEIDDQNRLRITGRVKEIFKTAKGKYVAPAPIENRLSAHPKIEAVCVTGASHPQPFAIAMLAPDAQPAFADDALREELTASLADVLKAANRAADPHERLDFIAVVPDTWAVENGFITPTMKIKRAAIEDTYGRFFEAWSAQRKAVVWHR